MLPYTELLFKPGSKYSYSNPGVIFLGRIIELFSGDDYEVYINKNIFMPLGMTRSFFDRAPYHLVAHRSHSYVGNRRGPQRAAVRLRQRHHGVQRRAERAARRHGEIPGVPDRRQRRHPEAVVARRDVHAADSRAPMAKAAAATTSRPACPASSSGTTASSWSDTAAIRTASSRIFTSTGRPRSGYIVSFNTDVTSKRDPRHTTRAVDDDLRDAIIRELFWSEELPMTLDALRQICRALPGVTEDVKWGHDLCFCVGGKMFAVVNLEPPHRLSSSARRRRSAELVERPGSSRRRTWLAHVGPGEELGIRARTA